ncbi:hypothetical protein [Flavobacterium araucananum]|nr:hypothetical protein [Flavobacterium araucananum]
MVATEFIYVRVEIEIASQEKFRRNAILVATEFIPLRDTTTSSKVP